MARPVTLIALMLSPLLASSVTFASDPVPLNSDAAVPGYFVAGSARKDGEALGGFARSDNLPKRLDRAVPTDRLSLIAFPAETATFGSHRGFTVFLANATSRELGFEASDSRLSVIREARDTNGRWREIEYLPSSWCGNSYHRVFLPAGHYWTFAAPEYSGSFHTKMRFVLTYGKGQRIYSNEFEGFINPSQFEKRQALPDGGWMDPYTPQPPPQRTPSNTRSGPARGPRDALDRQPFMRTTTIHGREM